MIYGKLNDNFINFLFLNINNIKFDNFLVSCSFKYVYSQFFFQRFIMKKFNNNSLFSFYSYFPKNKHDSFFFHYSRYSFIFFNKNFLYWLNNYLTRERYNPLSMKNNFLTIDYKKYLYV